MYITSARPSSWSSIETRSPVSPVPADGRYRRSNFGGAVVTVGRAKCKRDCTQQGGLRPWGTSVIRCELRPRPCWTRVDAARGNRHGARPYRLARRIHDLGRDVLLPRSRQHGELVRYHDYVFPSLCATHTRGTLSGRQGLPDLP